MSIYQNWRDNDLPLKYNSKLYILSESTGENTLLPQLEFHSTTTYKPLWQTANTPRLERYAPYLIEAKENSSFDAWISSNEGVPHTVISAQLTIEELYIRLRFFTKFEDANKKYFLRIGAPAMFHIYLTSIANNYKTLEKLFNAGRIDGFLFQDPPTKLSRYYFSFFERHPDTSNDKNRNGHLQYVDFNVANAEKGASHDV